VFAVVGEQPIRFAEYSGEKHRDVAGMPDQMSAGSNQVHVWVRDNFRAGEFDEATIVLDQLVGVERRQTLRM